jgi:hypothetical protein
MKGFQAGLCGSREENRPQCQEVPCHSRVLLADRRAALRDGLEWERGKMRRAVVLALLLLTACSTASASRGDDAEELLRTSEALLDAITTGDRTAFHRTIDPDGLFSDEEGNVRTVAEYLPAGPAFAAISTLPPWPFR